MQKTGLDPYGIGHPDSVRGRSPQWPTVRKHHLQKFPFCCVSGLTHDLDVHHFRAFHIHPELELDPDNLRTISRPYHFLIGHLCNWKVFNPDFDEMVKDLRRRIEHAKKHPREFAAFAWLR